MFLIMHLETRDLSETAEYIIGLVLLPCMCRVPVPAGRARLPKPRHQVGWRVATASGRFYEQRPSLG